MKSKDKYLSVVCEAFQLGELISLPKPLSGGLLHRVWQVKTTKNSYVIKEIDRNITALKNNLSAQIYESIAQQLLAQGVSTIAAISINGNYSLTIHNRQFLVFPWIAGETKNLSSLSAEDAYQIGKLLASIHRANLPKNNLPLPEWHGFGKSYWQMLLQQIIAVTGGSNREFQQWYLELIEWDNLAQKVTDELQQCLVVSHRDLTNRNVLWINNNSPILLDWEYAGLISPCLELFITALNWSVIISNKINEKIFVAVLRGYKSVINILSDFSAVIIYGYIAYVLDWIEFNWRRIILLPANMELAQHEIKQSLQALRQVNSQLKNLTIAWNSTLN